MIKPFEMTPFLRTVWMSQAAKDKWEVPIRSCSQLVQDLEIESVVAGQRECAWRTVSRETLPRFIQQNAEKNLVTIPVRWVGSWEGFIHHTPPGDTQAYCIISRTIESALKYRAYFEAGDNDGQGAMLGFPKCCREFFTENWAKGYFDPIWQAWKNSEGANHPYSNPLLRYIGIRVGFHIPHSFRCEQTVLDGKDRLALAHDAELVQVLEALLSMPMTWEALHGIAVIRTPIFYVITSTVPTKEKYTVKIEGKFIPREAEDAERVHEQTGN